MNFASRALVLVLVLMLGAAHARNGSEALNHYGLVTLSDNAVGARLAARFKARGQPVFLVHDVNAGLGQNDIMRFSDKAVLIDGDVWSTLVAEGALDKLRAAPLVRVQGRATSASWGQRAELVAGERQRKAFRVGAELLRVLEENFGGAPQGQQLTVVFEQDHLTLLAPATFLDQLRFSNVRKVTAGRPTMISTPPDSMVFANEPFAWQSWAADPSDPSGELNYQLTGELPPGLTWNASTHTLAGRPTTAGRWRLNALVQNSSGFRDTLAFVLRVRQNKTPYLSGEPGAIAVAEREWRFAPKPFDEDHPGYALRVTPGTLPPGMTFLADSLSLRWTPPASLAGKRTEFSLQIEDALGARREHHYAIQVVAKEGILLSEGVKIEIPWDTLLVGRTYVWKTGAITTAWESQGIRLLRVDGSDSTLHAHDSLIVIPRQAGKHHLEFRFSAHGKPLVQTLSLPVREDLPPEFVTELPEWSPYSRGTRRSYRPVAVDPEGEVVTLTADLPAGGPVSWDGKRLHFDAARRGTFPARLTARDAGGKTAEQWVIFEAEPLRSRSRHILEGRMHGEFTTWTYTRDFGTGRIGVYSPNITYGVIPSSRYMYRETPFFFVGGNLAGDDPTKPERVLWADIGLGFSNPAPRVFTGGIYTRLNGEWHFPGSALSWIEMEITGHIHHIMAATDSGTFAIMLLDPTDIIARDQLSEDGPLSNLIREGFHKENVRFFSRVEALGPLGWGFHAGPSMWRDDIVVDREYHQRFGAALRYRAATRAHLFQLSLRGGWGPGGEGWAAYGSMRMSLGVD